MIVMIKEVVFRDPFNGEERVEVEILDFGPNKIKMIDGYGEEVEEEYKFNEDGEIEIYI
jgi:hypothetical protein